MACSCKGRSKATYTWSNEDGTETQTYTDEIQAKAKVLRKGGSYVTNQPAPA